MIANLLTLQKINFFTC